MSLTTERLAFKPFEFPWAFDLWKRQQQIHWLPDEVPLADDIQDWSRLPPAEKNLLTHIFRFFTQSDIEVNNNYHQVLLRVFKPTEIVMMLSAFSNMETIHVAAYSHLLETIGLPAAEYEAFLSYKEMKDKFDYMRSFSPTDAIGVAENLAVFGAFTEGLQLFASFAILLNFPRFNKMKGMGQIVTWSVRDESLHCEGVIKLYHAWVSEHKLADRTILRERIIAACKEIVKHEDAFIDLAFELGGVEGLTPAEMKAYIRSIADKRLAQLDLPPLYGVKNPLPWLDEMLNAVEHANFFEARATEYSKGATKGDWDFSEL
jgi:ribonucleoside-diphosphate reductase beta chain